jgi:small subunit ribosomal protein S5
VGAGLGKAGEVPEAIRKAVESAKKHLVTVPMVGSTIPHEIRMKKGAARVMLKPAAPGTGIRSGGAMRAVVELSGVKDMITKSLGTNNPVNTVRATLAALEALQTAESIGLNRGRSTEEMSRLSRRGPKPVEPAEALVAEAEPEPVA